MLFQISPKIQRPEAGGVSWTKVLAGIGGVTVVAAGAALYCFFRKSLRECCAPDSGQRRVETVETRQVDQLEAGVSDSLRRFPNMLRELEARLESDQRGRDFACAPSTYRDYRMEVEVEDDVPRPRRKGPPPPVPARAVAPPVAGSGEVERRETMTVTPFDFSGYGGGQRGEDGHSRGATGGGSPRAGAGGSG